MCCERKKKVEKSGRDDGAVKRLPRACSCIEVNLNLEIREKWLTRKEIYYKIDESEIAVSRWRIGLGSSVGRAED